LLHVSKNANHQVQAADGDCFSDRRRDTLTTSFGKQHLKKHLHGSSLIEEV